MTFIRNNPTTQHRRATGRFENGKVNREQQENKTLQKMMQAGASVYTRGSAAPMSTGQVVATTLTLGTIGLLAGSALQGAQAAPVQSTNASFTHAPELVQASKQVTTCLNDYTSDWGNQMTRHQLINNCDHATRVFLKPECRTKASQPIKYDLSLMHKSEKVLTKNGAALATCANPFAANPTFLQDTAADYYVNDDPNPLVNHINGTESVDIATSTNPYGKGAFIRTTTFSPKSSLQFLKQYVSLLKAMPDPMKVASRTVKETPIRAGFRNIDPDKAYYHRFTNAQSDNSCHSGWRHYGAPVHSYSLTQAAMLQAYNEFYDDPSSMNTAVGIYWFGYQKDRTRWGFDGEVALRGTEFADAMKYIDLQGDYTKALNAFWAQNTKNYITMLKDSFQLAATNQRQTGQMTEGDYVLAMSVLYNRSSISCYKLDVYGYSSKDILLIESNRGKGGLLYIPGSSPAFTPYGNQSELRQKIIRQIKNPHNREILKRHFSLYDRQDGSSYSGVDSALKGLADATWNESYLMQKLPLMTYDIFAQVTEDIKATMASDGDTSIKSNAEARRDYFLEMSNATMNYLPVFDTVLPEVMIPAGLGLIEGQFGTSLDKAINGDTLDERMAGTYASAVTGALLGASLVIPTMAKVVSVLDGSLAKAETALLSAETEGSLAAETEITQEIPTQTIADFTNTPTQLIHPKSAQLLLGVELADSKEKVLLRALGNNQYAKVDPTTSERIGSSLVYKAMDPATGEAQWLEGAGLKGGMLPIADNENLLSTWDASDDEMASMRASSTAGSQREILFLNDLPRSDGYPDMTGAEVPEELAKLEQRARVDPLSIIPNPEILKKDSQIAIEKANSNPWRNEYSQEYINKVAYRGDGRLPDELFHSGFIRRPLPIRIIEIGEGDGIIGAVSTTLDKKIALKYAKHQTPGGYVYAVRLKNGGKSIDSKSLRGEPLSEVAVLNVPPEDIMFAVGPFDTVRTTQRVEGLNSIELRINPYSEATYEQAEEAYNALKDQLSSALQQDETICFFDRWEARKDLIFDEKDLAIYEKKLNAHKKPKTLELETLGSSLHPL